VPFTARSRVALVVAATAVTVVTGCTGTRGTLSATSAAPVPGGEAGQPVGDASVDAVLDDLERPMEQSFTATYAVTRKLGAKQATAVVSRGPLAISVTVGDVRYVRADTDHTCLLATKACEETINEARVSDLGLSSTFWRAAPARSLRVAYGRRAAPATGEPTTIAGQAARCATVAVGAGAETYCALATGAIARMDTAYVTIELTGYEPTVRQEAFALPTAAPAVGG
jgi:hypothetical protein